MWRIKSSLFESYNHLLLPLLSSKHFIPLFTFHRHLLPTSHYHYRCRVPSEQKDRKPITKNTKQNKKQRQAKQKRKTTRRAKNFPPSPANQLLPSNAVFLNPLELLQRCKITRTKCFARLPMRCPRLIHSSHSLIHFSKSWISLTVC